MGLKLEIGANVLSQPRSMACWIKSKRPVRRRVSNDLRVIWRSEQLVFWSTYSNPRGSRCRLGLDNAAESTSSSAATATAIGSRQPDDCPRGHKPQRVRTDRDEPTFAAQRIAGCQRPMRP